MRKNTHSPVRAAAIAVALVIALSACNRGDQASQKSVNTGSGDAVASIGAADAVASAPLSAPARQEEGAMGTNASAAAPPMEQHAGNRAEFARRDAGAARQVSLGSGMLPPAIDAAGSMLVRTGEATVEVQRVPEALARIRQISAQFGGFVANTSVHNGKNEDPSATLELRVPTAQFDALVNALSTLGKVERVSAAAQDVGEEYVDLGARASNARRMEARLVELLATRTGRLSDVLMVEHELQRVREEIERYDARLRFLERRAAMSTLAVTLHEPIGLIDRRQPGPLVNALALAWERSVSVIAWMIASLGVLIPLGLLIGGGFMIFRRSRWARPADGNAPSVSAT